MQGFAVFPHKPSPWGEGAPVRTLGRMRGQVSDFLLWGAPFYRVSPCGASDFLSDEKVTKESPGDAYLLDFAELPARKI